MEDISRYSEVHGRYVTLITERENGERCIVENVMMPNVTKDQYEYTYPYPYTYYAGNKIFGFCEGKVEREAR